ncbi:hypothetical protein GGX14DRAFT_571793 [Mycena pura]|uniref:Uncharacterized protein n=1 Tax=Mycena pura TaxID=153505 RepID=A0AAD6V6C4_9AGAR|nr:hypothetical protein GGX14DRAFT_571793 [Mycena pura]
MPSLLHHATFDFLCLPPTPPSYATHSLPAVLLPLLTALAALAAPPPLLLRAMACHDSPATVSPPQYLNDYFRDPGLTPLSINDASYSCP